MPSMVQSNGLWRSFQSLGKSTPVDHDVMKASRRPREALAWSPTVPTATIRGTEGFIDPKALAFGQLRLAETPIAWLNQLETR